MPNRPQNRLQQLHDAGQSIWLDYIDRTMLQNGELERRIREDALTGMTSNPTIFEKALAEGSAYDEQLASLAAEGNGDVAAMFEAIETDDVRAACDIFRPVYAGTHGEDGYVSIEVSPQLAHDADGTVVEALRLWHIVDRPNVMVKVPGTAAGAVAIRRLIAAGVNVNVTLLFSLDAYARVIDAYQGGLGDRLAAGAPIAAVASVASFFVSRVDSEIDKQLDALGGAAAHLKGRAAIANAKIAYALFRQRFAGPAWNGLARQGGRVQRPLWASTSTKNPRYRDVMYVEELIGPDTVNTLPPATLEAFRDHGVATRTVDSGTDAARHSIEELAAAGIVLSRVTDGLLTDGIASFQKSFDTLLAGLARKTQAVAIR
jgi:transaldolase